MSGIRKRYELPVLCYNNQTAISNKYKAELLEQTLVKIHSSENVSDRARLYRESTIALNPVVALRKSTSRDGLDLPFTLFELKKAISNA